MVSLGTGSSQYKSLERGDRHLHGGSQDQWHLCLGSKGGKNLDILLEKLCINGVDPSAGTNLVINQDHSGVFDVESCGKVLSVVKGRHDGLVDTVEHGEDLAQVEKMLFEDLFLIDSMQVLVHSFINRASRLRLRILA